MPNPKKGNGNKTQDAKAPAAAEASPDPLDQTAASAGGPAPDDPPAGDPPDDDAPDAPDDDTPDDAAPEPEPEPEPVKKSAPIGDKKATDKARRDKLIHAHADAVKNAPIDEKFEAGEKRRGEIDERMGEIAGEVAAHDEVINTLRDESAELLLELYPQQGESDKFSTAVRGYLDASARDRQHRKLAPGRLKALLIKAGLAPIDAAFSRARGRGMARPQRKPAAKAAAPAADQAKDAKPIKKAE